MGLVRTAIAADGKAAAIVEVNSETDFVAKNDEFVTFVETLAQMALENDAKNMDEFMALPYGDEGSVQDVLTSKIATIGEKHEHQKIRKGNWRSCCIPHPRRQNRCPRCGARSS